jgi:hypothetical protein
MTELEHLHQGGNDTASAEPPFVTQGTGSNRRAYQNARRSMTLTLAKTLCRSSS